MSGTEILETAISGGINHWAHVDFHSRRSATITDLHEKVEYTVTAGDMNRAKKKVLEMFPNIYSAQAIRNDDIDCEAADVIFQVAVHGDIIYG